MAVSKMTLALAGLLVPGVLAITPYSGQSTVTAEPEQIGSTTSDGVLVYSMNYCTIVQNTQCQVSLSTGNAAVPTAAEEPSAAVSVPISAPGTGETAAIPGEPAPTTIAAGTDEAAPEASQTSEPGVPASVGQPTPTVISTTDEVGNPTFVSSTALAATGPLTTSGGSASASGSGAGEHSNSTSHEGHSGTASGPSAPDHTGAGAAFQVLPGLALGAAFMAMACIF